MWIIAVDAGGTKCKARLYNMQGDVIAQSQTGPANMFTDFEAAIAAILQAVDTLLVNNISAIKAKDCVLSIGAAGANVPIVKQAFSAWQHPFKQAFLYSDLYISCVAANQGQDSVFIVVGTGSSVGILNKQQFSQYGGHGFLLGDEASGAWLAKNVLSWYLRALEQLIDENELDAELALMACLKSLVGNKVSAIIEKYGQAKADVFGALVPSLLAIKQQSPCVQAFLHQGVSYLANVLEQHAQNLPVYIGGGLASVYQPMLQQLLNKPVLLSEQDPTFGAYCVINTSFIPK